MSDDKDVKNKDIKKQRYERCSISTG
jgi:hypothetical protein